MIRDTSSQDTPLLTTGQRFPSKVRVALVRDGAVNSRVVASVSPTPYATATAVSYEVIKSQHVSVRLPIAEKRGVVL